MSSKAAKWNPLMAVSNGWWPYVYSHIPHSITLLAAPVLEMSDDGGCGQEAGTGERDEDSNSPDQTVDMELGSDVWNFGLMDASI